MQNWCLNGDKGSDPLATGIAQQRFSAVLEDVNQRYDASSGATVIIN